MAQRTGLEQQIRAALDTAATSIVRAVEEAVVANARAMLGGRTGVDLRAPTNGNASYSTGDLVYAKSTGTGTHKRKPIICGVNGCTTPGAGPRYGQRCRRHGKLRQWKTRGRTRKANAAVKAPKRAARARANGHAAEHHASA